MSGSEQKPVVARPWHDGSNPFEALHDWMLKEIARLEALIKPAPVAPPRPVVPPQPVQPPAPANVLAGPGPANG